MLRRQKQLKSNKFHLLYRQLFDSGAESRKEVPPFLLREEYARWLGRGTAAQGEAREVMAPCRLLQFIVCCRQPTNCHCFPSRQSAGGVLSRFGRRLLRLFRACLSADVWPVEKKRGPSRLRCRCKGPWMRDVWVRKRGVPGCGLAQDKSLGGRGTGKGMAKK